MERTRGGQERRLSDYHARDCKPRWCENGAAESHLSWQRRFGFIVRLHDNRLRG